jgi:hypothetical protein
MLCPEPAYRAMPPFSKKPKYKISRLPNACHAAKSQNQTPLLLISSSQRSHAFAVALLIWNVAPGSSDVSAWTVALMPMLASAPRMTPQGNQRNCGRNQHRRPRSRGERGRTGWARATAWPPASVLMREKGRNELSVRT